jgi:acetyl esterase/lipase
MYLNWRMPRTNLSLADRVTIFNVGMPLVVLVLQTLAIGSLRGFGPQPLQRPVVRDVAYVPDGDSKHRLDLHLPSGKGFATVLFIHGGGLTEGDKDDDDYRAVCDPFPASDIACATINYRLFPAVKWPVPAQDAAAAFSWLRSHIAEYGGSPGRLFLFGHSSGCLLASLLGTDPGYLHEHDLKLHDIAGVVAMGCRLNDKIDSGGATTEQIRRHFERDPYDAGFGSIEALNQAVPKAHVSANMPPFLILIAEGEQVNPPILEDSKAFVAAAHETGAIADWAILSGLTHYSSIRNAKSVNDPTFRRIRAFVAKW